MKKVLPKKVWIPIIIIEIILFVSGSLVYQYWWLLKQEVNNLMVRNEITPKGQENNIQQKACTMEAKVCPDGSSVGRTGQNCEFAACPVGKIDETANCPIEDLTSAIPWKTYVNTQYGFELQYPSNWNKFEDSSEDKISEIRVDNSVGDSFFIVIEENPFNLTPKEWVKMKIDQDGKADRPPSIFSRIRELKMETINNILAWSADNVNNIDSRVKIILIPDNRYMFMISLPQDLLKDCNDKLIEEFNKVFSTFKFTN